MRTKICTDCGEDKPLEQFHINRKNRDGRRGRCKTCTRVYQRKYIERLAQSRTPISEKRCIECGQVKSVTEFHKLPMSKDGYRPMCGTCRNASRRQKRTQETPEERSARLAKIHARYYRDREKMLERSKRYREMNQEKLRHYHREYYQRNREKLDEKNRRWAQENPEQARSFKRRYYLKNRNACIKRAREHYEVNKDTPTFRVQAKARWQRRRQRKRRVLGELDPRDIIRQWHRQNGECFYCGDRCGGSPYDTSAYNVEHLTPLSRSKLNPTNYPRNIVVACQPCNYSKGAKTVAEFKLYRLQSGHEKTYHYGSRITVHKLLE